MGYAELVLQALPTSDRNREDLGEIVKAAERAASGRRGSSWPSAASR